MIEAGLSGSQGIFVISNLQLETRISESPSQTRRRIGQFLDKFTGKKYFDIFV